MGVPEMDELSLCDSDVDFFVRNALKSALMDDSDFYNQLVGIIHNKERLDSDRVGLLVACLKAVTGAVSCIHIVHHERLLAAIFAMNLWNYKTNVMDALIELLISLASASGEFVDLCLELLVINFTPPSSNDSYIVDMLKNHGGIAKKNNVSDRVHLALEHISSVVPLSPLKLAKMVKNKMPNIYAKEHYIMVYAENMLRLENGALGEFVGSSMLTILLDRLIDLDVELPWDDILQDDFQKGIFDMELEDLEWDADHIEQDGDELTREAFIQRFFNGNLIAEKLDRLMVLICEHLLSCNEGGRLAQVFETFLQSFQKTILTAYKSKFAQFVMFYACSLDPEYCGRRFASMLLDIFVSSPNPEWRMSAVAYLGSYLARAKFVSPSYAATMLESVVQWCFKYCKNQVGEIDPRAHKVFYAGCQTIMYMLCFRMREMLSMPRIKSQLLAMRVEDILGSCLKPLQVCSPSVVEVFVKLVKANSFYCLPENVDTHGLIESENSQAFGGLERFDVFFPFDPCYLRKCDRFIRPNYVYWSMVRSTYEEGYDDDKYLSDGEDVADAYVTENGISIPVSDGRHELDDEFDLPLDKMSITPRDSINKFGGRTTSFTQMPSRIRPSTSPQSL